MFKLGDRRILKKKENCLRPVLDANWKFHSRQMLNNFPMENLVWKAWILNKKPLWYDQHFIMWQANRFLISRMACAKSCVVWSDKIRTPSTLLISTTSHFWSNFMQFRIESDEMLSGKGHSFTSTLYRIRLRHNFTNSDSGTPSGLSFNWYKVSAVAR